MTNETRSIEAADIVDFTFKVQQAVLDGYRLSDQGDLSPQNIGFMYITTMMKEEYNPMPVGELSLAISVDTEQAVAQLQEIANNVGEVDTDSAAQIIAQALTVEPSSVAPKTTQRRGRK
jgi:hypothetical protein